MNKYTYSARDTDRKEKWYLVDAEGLIVGRLASVVASRLRGKHNPLYTPHVDMGDSIIVINAEKIIFTGKKLDKKCYYRHSGYIGGLTTTIAKDMLKNKPENVIRLAVKGMLPKNSLGRKLLTKLRIYAGDKHPHTAQQPEVLDVKKIIS